MKYKILIVCSANKGRSASFHAIMQHEIIQKNLPVEIKSAGTGMKYIQEFIKTGETGAAEWLIDILPKMGYPEILNHKTEFADEKMANWADLVLAYNTKIRNQLKKWYPEYKNKIMTVRGFITGKEGNLSSEALDVDDAYHPNNKLYRNRMQPQTHKSFYYVCNESRRLVDAVLKKLVIEKKI